MIKLVNKMRWWAFKKLTRWYLESMDQHDRFRMKTSFGYGYVDFSMQPQHESMQPESYREV